MVTRRHALGLLTAAATAPVFLAAATPRVFAEDSRPILRVAVQAIDPTLDPLESIDNVGLRAVDCLPK